MDNFGYAAASDALGQLSFTTMTKISMRAGEEGLSLQQIRLLGIIEDREPTMGELGELLELDKSSVSGLVLRAEKHGLVTRLQHELDGRSVRVRLELKGRLLIEAARRKLASDLEQVFAVLSFEELTEWTSLTKRLLASERKIRAVPL